MESVDDKFKENRKNLAFTCIAMDKMFKRLLTKEELFQMPIHRSGKIAKVKDMLAGSDLDEDEIKHLNDLLQELENAEQAFKECVSIEACYLEDGSDGSSSSSSKSFSNEGEKKLKGFGMRLASPRSG